MRPKPLLDLLNSVKKQSLYPNEILIIDGSTNEETKLMLSQNIFQKLIYHKVPDNERGLTKQRNYGINRTSPDSEVICFLDDDTILEHNYFEEIINEFKKDNNIVGVSGVAINEYKWERKQTNKSYSRLTYYQFEDYVYPEGLRNIVRNIFGLQSNLAPGRMPEFSNGRTCGFPLNDKSYEVDLLIGMSFSFRRIVFESNKFSNYFEGYGLYEDADYSLRALNYGKNVVTTKAKLSHFHDSAGRPNKFLYGKMVVRNGWFVWRVKYPKPSLKARMKWNAIVLLLTFIRFSNIFTTNKRQEAATEFLGRFIGWISLFISKPKEN
jgi:GT2 family glycosyltransferase